MSRRFAVFLGSLTLIITVVLAINYILVQRSLSTVLNSDTRNKGISALAHYDYLVNPKTLVFDLQVVSETNSPVDIFRVLLQFAATQKDCDYETVKLSFKGQTKFLLKGSYFKTLGVEFETQNPVYTMRTLPENVIKPDGTAAFGTWTGGWIGVFGKQMEDFIEFHKQWYINDLSKAGS